MADAIIKVPGPVFSTKGKNLEAAKSFKDIVSRPMPDSCKEVDSYETVELIAVPQGIKSKVDFLTGNKRNPRWGVHMGLSVTPDLDKIRPGPIMAPVVQTQFFTADTLEELRDRLVFEINQILDMSRLAAANPEAYAEFQQKALVEMMERQQAGDPSNDTEVKRD